MHRFETESYTFEIANLILGDMTDRYRRFNTSRPLAGSLRILDLCTGTGCISLLLHALLAPHIERLIILGIDLSATAVGLARRNLEHNLRLGLLSSRSRAEVIFQQADVLGREQSQVSGIETLLRDKYLLPMNKSQAPSSLEGTHTWDLLISNPPYLSPVSFRNGTTARSVRIYEPRLALVPPLDCDTNNSTLGGVAVRHEDLFYPRLLSLSFKVRARFTVLECGDLAQARRVTIMAETLIAQLPDCKNFAVDIWQPGYDNHNEQAAQAVIIRKIG
jgi:methylase of polypeptide subunit release factors